VRIYGPKIDGRTPPPTTPINVNTDIEIIDIRSSLLMLKPSSISRKRTKNPPTIIKNITWNGGLEQRIKVKEIAYQQYRINYNFTKGY
jgi:hypothetical protein